MNRHTTNGIVLSRTNFGEADRILTILTDSHGKLHLLAKGVRREKSKMAGGIELLSVSQFSFIRGRSDLGTLVSSRMNIHWGNIVTQMPRTMLAYDLLKLVNRVTEDDCDSAYFTLLSRALAALNDVKTEPQLVEAWLIAQLLKQGGHMPNLNADAEDNPLDITKKYGFDTDGGRLVVQTAGTLEGNHIKLLRLLFSNTPESVARVKNYRYLLPPLHAGLQHMAANFLH